MGAPHKQASMLGELDVHLRLSFRTGASGETSLHGVLLSWGRGNVVNV